MSSDCDEEEGREQRNQGDDAMKRAHQERPQETLRHEPDGLGRMSRRPSSITQADVARVLRAAKQAGAAEVEVRTPSGSTIIIRIAAPSTGALEQVGEIPL
jgi:hypothetical protein